MCKVLRANFLLCLLISISLPYHVNGRRQACVLSTDIETVYMYKTEFKNATFTTNYSEVAHYGDENIIKQDGKRCTCSSFENEFCFDVHEVDTCSVDRSWRTGQLETTYCFKEPGYFRSAIRLIWVPAIFLATAVLIIPFSTVMGRNAMQYVFSPCFPCFKTARVERILNNEIEAITHHIAIEASFGRDDGKVEQTILKLKTKSLSEGDQSNSNDTLCLICMVPLDEGEMIGDLSCGHNYHVDCLKEWLKRRNVCPLCSVKVADEQTILVDKEEAFENDDGEIDEEARSRFNRLLTFYNHRTSRRMQITLS